MTLELLAIILGFGSAFFAGGRGYQQILARLDSVDSRLNGHADTQKKLARRLGRVYGWALKHRREHQEAADGHIPNTQT